MNPTLRTWLNGGYVGQALAHRIEDGGKSHYPFGLSPLVLVAGGMVTALILKR